MSLVSMKYLLVILSLSLLTSCSWRPHSAEYDAFYEHLDEPVEKSPQVSESDHFLVLLVDAPHLDYSDNRSLMKTMVKHPSTGSKNSDVGHAWVYLEGIQEGKKIIVEGGHSGERGVFQPKYFEGIMNYVEYGYADPIPEQKRNPRKEPNPIKYLWATQEDGFFEKGAGNHTPTFAAKIDLTPQQFEEILQFIDPSNYHYSHYTLTRAQCSTFVAQVASLAGLTLEHEVTIKIEPTMTLGKGKIPLWTDERYA